MRDDSTVRHRNIAAVPPTCAMPEAGLNASMLLNATRSVAVHSLKPWVAALAGW